MREDSPDQLALVCSISLQHFEVFFQLVGKYTVCSKHMYSGHIGDENFVHCSEFVPSSEVEMYGQLYVGRGHCKEVVHSSECPLLEVSLYKF